MALHALHQRNFSTKSGFAAPSAYRPYVRPCVRMPGYPYSSAQYAYAGRQYSQCPFHRLVNESGSRRGCE